MRRLVFAFIALFWGAMNVWLWRSEIGGKNQLGTLVPADLVWQKILTAPDDSGLDVLVAGKKIGHLRWRANVGEEFTTGKVAPADAEIEGRVKQPSGYTVDLDGNLLVPQFAGRLRLEIHASFATNHTWKDFSVRGGVRRQVWTIEGAATNNAIRLSADDEGEQWQREFSFADLTNPTKLIAEFGAPGMLGLLSLPAALPATPDLRVGLVWEARKDWFSVGHAKVRAYRLRAKLLDRYQAVVLVSRVGEILRVELPHDIVMVNDAFAGL